VALITGASRGIGLAVAKAFADEGAKLAVCSRDESEIKLAAQGIAGKPLALGCDVCNGEQVKEMVDRTVKQLGRIDVLVNNAGDAISAPIVQTDMALWEKMINSNLTSVFLCTRAVLPYMIEQKSGRIINISSIAGKMGGKYISAYSSAKHGVIGFTRCTALEMADHRINCNAICPGYVDTPMTERSIKNISEKTGVSVSHARRILETENAQRRLIKPEEVATVAVFLASDEAAGVTGEAVNIW
jgi:NAD(P)-dependent dehydrogenase (short-subunit alcohol dehydrogenase family)